ncbi:MAG: helix-turn-helix domain-containing protein [Rhizobacter sp.]
MNELSTPLATAPQRRAAPVGLLSSTLQECAYIVHGGVMFTTPWVHTGNTLRRCGSISITAEGQPFELQRDGEASLHQVTAIKPMVTHRLLSQDAKFVGLLINPLHPKFRMFRGMSAKPGVLSLDRQRFSKYDAALIAASNGELDGAGGRALFNGLIDTVSQHLPPLKLGSADEKSDRVIALLHADVNRSLTELAASEGLSYTRMSHVFTQSMGISLRNYQLWLKIHNALGLLDAGVTLTEIAKTTGFADLAHLSRVAAQALGAPLSYFKDRETLRKIYCAD